ncbi:GNAT family N-acetyltransferase [Candidatus Formimonas warabiya]|uniref:N-acetyltransferase domain-containing protein n=1 Tax=Formimonas warabiya TaxID=1761012 RepID=A0A3G1KRL8_FORW1|nr:GNAT family N-acetyltransferase [Candidatus Formimonas warabiya]ATW25098.1 hypothetical protein DCMF_10215 [Candidatus Formimonas warabiya]
MDIEKIRKASLFDEKEILNCANISYEMYIGRLGKKPQPMLDNYASLIAAGNVYVTEWNGQIVGILVLLDFEDYVLLDNVAVIPSYQGKGIGKSLIKYAENYAVERGVKEIRLYTNVKMVENISIYKKLGYIAYDQRCENGYDRIYFRKAL